MERKAEPNSPDYRIERKFVIHGIISKEVEFLIKSHPAVFTEIYPLRPVNNIYFDSISFKNYTENIDGCPARRKMRIRWYGDLFGYVENPVLELKTKNGLLGRKYFYPLDPFYIHEKSNISAVLDAVKNIEQEKAIRHELKSLKPTILNHYNRRYYQSADRNYRLTMDTDVEYFRIGSYNNNFLHKINNKTHVILELKYTRDIDHKAGYITNCFPFRVTKNSKYVEGIEELYSWQAI
ncbi:MAG TPA: VTC domain-containing protein [archaeon]|nr:VTC domain-containing protein [archaeon]